MREKLKLLVAEDGEDEIVLLKRAFELTRAKFDARFVRSGEEAMYYLAGARDFADRSQFPIPAMVLMDLKMPRMDGFELLRWIRTQRELEGLVVVVFSSSDEQADVNRAYQLGANSYIVKPSTPSRLSELVSLLQDYWVSLNKFPQLGAAEVGSTISSG